jgi:hypothetical protein
VRFESFGFEYSTFSMFSDILYIQPKKAIRHMKQGRGGLWWSEEEKKDVEDRNL